MALGIISQEYKQGYQDIEFEMNRDSCMELIERELYEALSDSKDAVREMCSHIMNAGGKRIRPLLVMYSGLVFSAPGDRLIKAAVAAELIHMASLVHDDIIDNSSLRRNKASVNKVWGTHFAVLCGDYLFAKAFGIMAADRLMKSMDYMVEAIQNMCRGEIQQAGDAFNCNVGLDTYYDRIAKKTAIFLECCCKSGAAAGGADEVQIEAMGEFGLHLGLAFQMMDDILDFYGDVDVMGKPKNEDLRQGNITLPVIFLLENGKYRDWIKDIIDNRKFTQETFEEITVALKESGSIDRSFAAAISHMEKARLSIGLLGSSAHTKLLAELVDMLGSRVK